MTWRQTVVVALSVGAWSCAGCAGAASIGIKLPKRTRFESEWRSYEKLPEFKSLAVAGDRAGVYVSGVAYDHRHTDSAVAAALRYCEERRVDRRIEAPCQTVAVNGESFLSDTGQGREEAP